MSHLILIIFTHIRFVIDIEKKNETIALSITNLTHTRGKKIAKEQKNKNKNKIKHRH